MHFESIIVYPSEIDKESNENWHQNSQMIPNIDESFDSVPFSEELDKQIKIVKKEVKLGKLADEIKPESLNKE